MFNWLRHFLAKQTVPTSEAIVPLSAEISLERSLEIAHELAKPCVLLKKDGYKFAAVWGGLGTISGPDDYRHWLSVDCAFLPSNIGLTKGVISVYSGGDDWDTGVVKFESNAFLELNGGEPLYAHESVSMPPPDASAELDTDAYSKIWQDKCPVYIESATAVIGGWHFPWPDGDWEELRDKQFVLWTIENSEPWIEVWKNEQSFRVCERVT